jgi:hypothetical protein
MNRGDDRSAHERFVDYVMRKRAVNRRKEVYESLPVRTLPPCIRCGGSRVPKLEVRVFCHEEIMPLLEQRVEAGMCISCAKKDVDRLERSGRLGDLTVHNPPREETE